MINNPAYIHTGPETKDCSGLCIPLVLCLLWHVERSRVDSITEVLVKGLREKVYVLFFECLVPVVHELGLWRSGVGHWNEVAEKVSARRCGKGSLPTLLLDPKVLYYACARTFWTNHWPGRCVLANYR